MKKGTSILVFITAVLIILIVVELSYDKTINHPIEPISSEQIYSTANYQSSQESSHITAMTSETTIYVIKLYKGHIGVFMNDNTVPFEEIHVEVMSLPEKDQQLLQIGIQADSINELRSILEDYQS